MPRNYIHLWTSAHVCYRSVTDYNSWKLQLMVFMRVHPTSWWSHYSVATSPGYFQCWGRRLVALRNPWWPVGAFWGCWGSRANNKVLRAPSTFTLATHLATPISASSLLKQAKSEAVKLISQRHEVREVIPGLLLEISGLSQSQVYIKHSTLSHNP